MTTNPNDTDYDDELEPGSPFRDGALHVLDDKCSTNPLRIAQRLGIIAFDAQPTKKA